jgi:hypothetical protein
MENNDGKRLIERLINQAHEMDKMLAIDTEALDLRLGINDIKTTVKELHRVVLQRLSI